MSRRLDAPFALGALLWVALGPACASARPPPKGPSSLQSLLNREERVESQVRTVDMAGLLDRREERVKLREALDALEREPLPKAPLARGAVHFALGRGALALGDVERAVEQLDAAWNEGLRDPRVAWTRGLALSQRYRDHLAEALAARDAEQQKAREQAAKTADGDPALALLRSGLEGEPPPDGYAAALLDFHEDRLDAALKRLESLDPRRPPVLEPLLLRADVLLMRARQKWAQESRDAARTDLKAARKALTLAGTLAADLPEAHLALARFEYAALGLTRLGTDVITRVLNGEGELQGIERGRAALDRAERAAPDSPEVRRWKARFQSAWEVWAAREPDFPGDQLGEAIESAKEELARAPDRPQERWLQATILVMDVVVQPSPRPRVLQALELARSLLEAAPPKEWEYEYQKLRGQLFSTWATVDARGNNPASQREHRTLAIEAYRKATSLNAYFSEPWQNLAWLLLERATDPATKDALADLDAAELAWRQLSVPTDSERWRLGGTLRIARARHRRALGQDARPDLDEAIARLQQGLVVAPHDVWLHELLGSTSVEQAREVWERGGNASALLDAAEAVQVRTTVLSTAYSGAKNGLGEVYVERAAQALRRGLDPSKDLEEAERFYRQGIELNAMTVDGNAGLARVLHLWMLYMMVGGGEPQPVFSPFEPDVPSVSPHAPYSPQRRRYEAEKMGLEAQFSLHRQRPEVAEAQFNTATQEFLQARAAAPHDQELRLAHAWLLRGWAVARQRLHKDVEPLLSQGLQLTDGLLAERPQWAEALLLRAALLRVKSPATPKARADRDAGLALNPNLKPWWKRLVPEDAHHQATLEQNRLIACPGAAPSRSQRTGAAPSSAARGSGRR